MSDNERRKDSDTRDMVVRTATLVEEIHRNTNHLSDTLEQHAERIIRNESELKSVKTHIVNVEKTQNTFNDKFENHQRLDDESFKSIKKHILWMGIILAAIIGATLGIDKIITIASKIIS